MHRAKRLGPVVCTLMVILTGAGPLAAGLPGEKDGNWIEVKGPHFTIVANGEGAARETAKRFEQMQAVFAGLFPDAPAISDHAFVVIGAKDEKTLSGLIPELWEGRKVAPAALYSPDQYRDFLTLRTDVPADQKTGYSMANWGYAAHFVGRSLPHLPLWAQRGLTTFYAYTTVESRRVLIGRAADDMIALLREGRLIPVARLFEADRQSPLYTDQTQRRLLDAEAWALVHYLMLGDRGAHRAQFAQFVSRTAQPGDRAAAATALGDPAALESALRNYLLNVSFFAQEVPTSVEVSPKQFPARPLSAAEAYAMRGAVHVAQERWADAEAALARAIELDPKLAAAYETWALLHLKRGNTGEGWASLQKALALDPASVLSAALKPRLDPTRPAGAGPRLAGSVSAPPAAVVAGAEQTCHAGDTRACLFAGVAYMQGDHGVAADGARARELLEAACTKSDANACAMLASALAFGQGAIAKDPAAATAFAGRACEVGEARMCAQAGALLISGRDPQQATRAAHFFEVGCDKADPASCSNLAQLLASGFGLVKDLARARALYEQACAASYQPACDARVRLGTR